MRKNLKLNKGIPLSVNYITDLPAIKNTFFDSWYVICNFECEGEKLGFEWHHQTQNLGEIGQIVTAEFLLLNADKNICIHNTLTEPVSENNGSDTGNLNVFSNWGKLEGNHNEMRLTLDVDDSKLNVILKPQKEVLYNGTTGLLHFIASDSHQFSFPNMQINGSLVIKGKEYKITNTTAWFDRQWGFQQSNKEGVIKYKPDMYQLSWLWLGMTLNDETEAISLWDAYQADGRHAFATFLKKDGTQINTLVDITYDGIWISKKTENSYPKIINISIPSEEFEIKIISLIEDPEFVRENVNIFGCQTLCSVTGTYQGKSINRNVIVEMLGDICGDE